MIQDTAPPTLVGGFIPLSGGTFKIGVMVGTKSFRANPVASSGTIHTYAVAVPIGSVVQMFVSSPLNVTTSSGVAIPTEVPSQLLQVSAQPQQTVGVTVD